MEVLGYDPNRFYTGRAPLEAASLGVKLGPRDWALRCNLVTVSDGIMADYSAGHITTREATLVMDFINEHLGTSQIAFFPGVSYRNLMVLRDRGEFDAVTTPPHDITGQPVEPHLPRGKDGPMLRGLMETSEDLLLDHEVNTVRVELGENPASMIWLWGQGTAPAMPSFEERFGLRAALISAVDLLKGLAISMKMHVIDVPGATGYLDTDYAAKGAYACAAINDYDLVFVHVEAPDEAGHDGNVKDKVEAIEQIDRCIVGPVLRKLEERGEPFRIMVLPDHATPVAVKTHTNVPVPFAMLGEGIESLRQAAFSEREAEQSDLKVDPGHELMGHFVKLHS
jgi:2,3-bisphosphoglycerate-independent phosphoglycerate mutase